MSSMCAHHNTHTHANTLACTAQRHTHTHTYTHKTCMQAKPVHTSVAIVAQVSFGIASDSMPKGRILEMDLPDDVAARILESNFLNVGEIKSMAKYSQLGIKNRGKWDELFCNRGVLADLLRETRGRNLHQVNFARQIRCFKQATKIAGTNKECEELSYRLRVMVAHLVSHRRASRKPPIRFASLGALLDFIEPEAECSLAAASVTTSPVEPTADAPMAMPPFCDGGSGQVVAVVDDPILVSSQESALSEPAGFDVLDELDRALFEVPAAAEPEQLVLATPTKKMAPEIKDTPEKAPMVSDEQMDAWLAATPAVAPSAKEYKAVAAVLKKPAAMKKVKTTKPKKLLKSSARDLLYSKVYHKMRYDMKKLGADVEETNVAARQAALRAVDAYVE